MQEVNLILKRKNNSYPRCKPTRFTPFWFNLSANVLAWTEGHSSQPESLHNQAPDTSSSVNTHSETAKTNNKAPIIVPILGAGTLQVTHQDDQPHQLGVGAFSSLAGDDVPLLWGADDDLGSADLLLAQLVIPRQFGHVDAITRQALRGHPRVIKIG